MLKYRRINADDDEVLAEIIRANLEKLHLNIPGTAYFDPELDHMSAYYNSDPKKRTYFVALDETAQVVGQFQARRHQDQEHWLLTRDFQQMHSYQSVHIQVWCN